MISWVLLIFSLIITYMYIITSILLNSSLLSLYYNEIITVHVDLLKSTSQSSKMLMSVHVCNVLFHKVLHTYVTQHEKTGLMCT